MKSCGAGKGGKRRAELMAARIQDQLAAGTYESDQRNKTTWEDFIELYREKGMQGVTPLPHESRQNL